MYVYVLVLIALMFQTSVAQARINWDKEINKHERQVTAKFNEKFGTTYMPIKYYKACRGIKAKAAYDDCNKEMEASRYQAWVDYWKKRNGVVGDGHLEVRLQQREAPSPLSAN